MIHPSALLHSCSFWHESDRWTRQVWRRFDEVRGLRLRSYLGAVDQRYGTDDDRSIVNTETQHDAQLPQREERELDTDARGNLRDHEDTRIHWQSTCANTARRCLLLKRWPLKCQPFCETQAVDVPCRMLNAQAVLLHGHVACATDDAFTPVRWAYCALRLRVRLEQFTALYVAHVLNHLLCRRTERVVGFVLL